MFQVYVFEGLSKNVTCLGFYENGQFMYSGGEDCMARIWDLRYVKSALSIHLDFSCGMVTGQKHKFDCFPEAEPNTFDFSCGMITGHSFYYFNRGRAQQCQRLFQVNAPVNCMCLHPNQATLIVGDQSGTIHVWDLTTDHNEQLVRVVSTVPLIGKGSSGSQPFCILLFSFSDS